MKPTEINTTKRLVNYLKLDEMSFKLITNSDYVIINDVENESEIPNVLKIRKLNISKKNGGKRVVYSCQSDLLSNTLKILNSNLNSLYKPPTSVHGYVKGRNIKTNAAKHLTKKYVLVLDIENYFDTVKSSLVEQSFKDLGFTTDTAAYLTKIVTFQSALVQGFNTSPTIANIVFYPLDKKMEKLDKNIIYSRYADDLYFSSNEEFNIEAKVQGIISEFGFRINKPKSKLMKRGWHQYVTGLTVFDKQSPRISKKTKRKLRQQIYYINKFGYRSYVLYDLEKTPQDYFSSSSLRDEVDSKIEYLQRKLNGWLLFINSIEPRFAKKYSDLLTHRKIEP